MKMIKNIEGYRTYRTYGSYGTLFIICSLLLFAATITGCSSESDSDEVPQQKPPVEIPVEVQSLIANYNEDVMPLRRAWLPPTGYELFDNAENVIGISFTQDGQDPKNGHFFRSSGKWRTNVEIDPSEVGTYYLYGYVPHTLNMGYSISSTATSGDNSAYSSGAVLTISNVPSIMPTDFCVVIGAKNGKNDYKETEDYSVTGLRRGNFAYEAAAISDAGGGSGNFVYLLFDHLYAALSFHIRVNGDYEVLRTIKLKEIELQSSTDDTPTKEKTTVVVTMAANDGSTDPITNVSFTPTGENNVKTSIFHSEDGYELDTDYERFTGHFMPKGVTKVFLTCTYDVYDKKGNLVRQNSKAENTIRLASLFDRFDEMRSGTRYNIYLTVHPTYMYVMSDPDLDNPEMKTE